MKAGWVALCVLALPALARADTLYWLYAKLPNGPTYADGGGDPMKYYVDETVSSGGGLAIAKIEQETRASYQLWQDVACAYIGFQFAGAITSASGLGIHADTKSVMGSFVTSSTDPRYADELGGGAAVGVALTYKNNGIIQGCDTEFNSADFLFTDDTPATHMDFPSLANHENGHCLGLDHDPNDFNSVMYPTVANGDLRRTLDAHDVDNVCQLYPETGALGSPCSGGSCGAGLTCIASPNGGNFCSKGCDPTSATSCETGFGCRSSSAIGGAVGACYPGEGEVSARIGGACDDASQCGVPNALCYPPTANWPNGYCTSYCDQGASECPAGSLCEQLDADHHYCVAACTTYQNVGSDSSPGSCRASYACLPTDTLGNGFCIPACTSDAACPSGARCLPDGVCYYTGDVAAHVGGACTTVADCPTGDFCIPATSGWPGGYCVAPCGGGQNAGRPCDADSICVVAGAEGQAFCLDACTRNSDCRGGYTCGVKVSTSQQPAQVCEPFCSTDADCPVGESCSDGKCVDPFAQDGGGSCVLCGDGGFQQSSSGGGGSTGESGPATPQGCGCGSGSATDLFGVLALGLFALRTRRREW